MTVSEKSLRLVLLALWLAYVPVLHVLLSASWAAQGQSNPISITMAIAAALPVLCSAIIGVVALLRRRKGLRWENQSSLLQAAAIFTISSIVALLLVYLAGLVIAAVGESFPRPFKHVFPAPLELLVGSLAYMFLGLVACAMLVITIPLAIPPIILLAMLFLNKRLTKRTFYIITSVSVFGWLVLGFVGLVMSAG
ncbi:MAG: hypothetical protein OYH77_08320 [Pseudomonadota bacterium]|nr:hypothetical protein [Pseudomonadota bacterium]